MTLVSRATFQSNDTTRVNDNSGGEVSPADVRLQHTDISDSVPFFGEDYGTKGGFSATAYDAGTKTTGSFTPVPASGNLQKYINGGAHTLAPPATDCSMVILITNNASAGAITTSGYTLSEAGDLTTTNTNKFMAIITVVGAISWLSVKAMQ
jgi:hypothetical protein